MKLDGLAASLKASAVAKGDLSAVDVVSGSLERIKRLEPQLNALITVMENEALERAALVDLKVASGMDPGPLAGVPVIVKDNMCTHGIRTTCGSRMLEKWVPLMMPPL